MKRPGKRADLYRRVQLRRRFLLVCWTVGAAALIARAVEVQILERSAWLQDAQRQHQKSKTVPAPRGRILDRGGGELAVSHWRASVGIAPNEIRNADEVRQALVDGLDLQPRLAGRMSASNRSWVVVPDRYSMTQVAGLRGLRGVHVSPELRRLYPREGLAKGLLGVVQDGVGRGGVEQSMDSVLAGKSGREIVARDNLGREIPGRVVTVERPVAGRDVVLTIDIDLQAIAEEILFAAVDSTGARGGDLIVTDPMTGEILALTSVVSGSGGALSAVNTPYEPGSTIKPFTASALLRHGVAELTDSVDTGEGRWSVNGRVISDIHGGGWLTLAEVITESSNVGIAKLARRLTPAQQFANLRDFGFGAPTGIPLPGEAAGLLRKPEDWSRQSPQSLAIGYELAVTPLQMAMAFGAIANGGHLMEPRLIKEVRGSDGQPLRFGPPREIRRAVPQWITDALTPVLVDVVEDGTGTRAKLFSFLVAGKSGTTRAVGADGRYEAGAYHSSFAAYFPADHPQLLFFVKLDRPRGEYYGGATAAPITRATLEALLSARQSPLDRRALAAAQRRPTPPPPTRPLLRFASALQDDGVARAQEPTSLNDRLVLPDLEGVPIRVAVRRLHKLGLRVRLDGAGAVRRTQPPRGARVSPGDTVRVMGWGS